MLNIEQLNSLAARAGFHTTVIRSSDVNRLALESRLKGEEGYSVCVAAPSYDERDRYRPLNYKSDDSIRLIERNVSLLEQAAGSLSLNGLMFVYGLPCHLARYATALSDDLVFRYWIAVRTMTAQKQGGLRPEHTGLLLLARPGARLNRIRINHARCRHCQETLKDWGGKSHLMHPGGVALSDVWMDLVVDPQDRIPAEVFERVLQLSSGEGRRNLLLLVPESSDPAGMKRDQQRITISAFDPLGWKRDAKAKAQARNVPEDLLDRLHKAPCLEVLRRVPSETVDLAFADPPFNLTKAYNGYSDDRQADDYIGWCKRWLIEYERVLKPGGALFVLNLPKWSVRLSDFLTRSGRLLLQNWIVWNSLPEPKGVLMPAHYALLYFTKGERAARFNYCSMENGWEPFDEAVFPPDRPDVCRRRSCIRKRRDSGHVWRGELTDIWYDIPRVRQPRRAPLLEKTHPCETPELLIDRIIRLSTNPGDLVLDAFAGTGTTAFVARRLARRFIAIEQDDGYLRVAHTKMSYEKPVWQRPPVRVKRGAISRRGLEIELQRLARLLGRLPTKADVRLFSKQAIETFESRFSSWGEALKAAKIVVDGFDAQSFEQQTPALKQLEMFESNLLSIVGSPAEKREAEKVDQTQNEGLPGELGR